MKRYFERKLTRFVNWILYYSEDIKNTISLYNDIREIKARLNKLEKSEEKRDYKDKNKQIWGDHA